MDSAYKNQQLKKIADTVGTNQNAIDPNLNTMFLLIENINTQLTTMATNIQTLTTIFDLAFNNVGALSNYGLAVNIRAVADGSVAYNVISNNNHQIGATPLV